MPFLAYLKFKDIFFMNDIDGNVILKGFQIICFGKN